MLTDPTMRVIQLIDHDKQFEKNVNQSSIAPIILSNFDLSDPNYIEYISDLIFSDGAGADFIAKCSCKATEGNNKVGMICPICKTAVSRNQLLDEDNLTCQNWLASPVELPDGWLAPKIYLNLSTWLSYDNKGKKNYLDDILNVDAVLPHDLTDVIHGQGFQYFFDNFDRIMNFFIYDHPVIRNKPDTNSMNVCLKLYKDRLFCHYIPILNSAIAPIISPDTGGTNRKRYSDVTADHIMRAAISLSKLNFSPKKKKNRQLHVERTAYKAFKDIISYVEESTKKYVSVKKAIPRTHLFGSRFHYSFRGVIVPIIGDHEYDELHIPWKMAVNTLRVHLHGILCKKYKMTINEATTKVRLALNKIDPLIKEIMDQLIADSPFKGLACTWDRPPSIRDGSVTLKFWTKIKPDLGDSAVGISSLDVALPNADFDGDIGSFVRF